MRSLNAPPPYFAGEGFTLYRGDCLELLERFPAESVDMVFADPPYRLSNGGFTVQSGRRAPCAKGAWDRSRGREADFAFHRQWIRAVKRVMKPHATIWVSGTYHSIYQCGWALELENFHLLNEIVWYKPNAGPNLSCRYFTASHETLIWARRERRAKHTFHYRWLKEGEFREDFLKRPQTQMRSVWAINTAGASEKRAGRHPTQKPLKLLERVILAATNDGELVLDPFAGSATSGIACARWGRNYVGIEIEEQYLELARRRWEAFALAARRGAGD